VESAVFIISSVILAPKARLSAFGINIWRSSSFSRATSRDDRATLARSMMGLIKVTATAN